jgi:hypothetical protein
MSNKICHGLLLTTAAFGFATMVAGCAATVSPELDARFGDAVRAVREQQILNPGAAVSQDPVLGVEGAAAVSTQERYQDSFKSPPKTFEVLGIGGMAK